MLPELMVEKVTGTEDGTLAMIGRREIHGLHVAMERHERSTHLGMAAILDLEHVLGSKRDRRS